MTNLQGNAANPWIARLLLWGPISAGGLLAILVLAIATVPLISQVQLQSRQQEEKRALEVRLPQLRAELERAAREQQRGEGQQRRLLELIAGSGDLVTFMAQADREARQHGVELQLYEPTQPLVEAKADKKDDSKTKPEEEPANKDNLEQAGLSSHQLLISAKGSYPNLLAFLRALERLSLLVVQSSVSLTQSKPAKPIPTKQQAQGSSTPTPELKMAITLYSATSKK